ncbi:MAG: nucleotidyltransferase domain-containing protein [Chloroflexota bacterium]
MGENDAGWIFLGRSAIRRRILALLALNPERRYHLREIARQVGTSAGTASREAKRLEDAGIVERTREGRQVYYQAMREGILFESLESVMRRTMGAHEILRREIGGIAGVKSAVIFGSYVSGKMRLDSDIDLLVVGTPDRDELTEALERAQAAVGRQINEVVMDAEELADRRRRGDAFIESIDSGRTIEVLP